MSHVTGNIMTLEHFHDFYFLEALQARLNMAKSANPELQFRHSAERLERDINETFAQLTHSMALRIYVYLYAASLGEARNADDNCEMSIHEISGMSRNQVFRESLDYFPNDENIQILTDVYTQRWASSGYGGRAWLEIVEGMKLYGKIHDAAFIDHAVDLEHNSGSVFTKETDNIKFECFGHYNSESLKYFLDWKFSQDILNTECWNRFRNVSTKVYNLIVRFSNIIETLSAVEYCKPTLEFLSPYTVEWRFETFTMEESEYESGRSLECEWCRARMSEDHFHYNSDCICEDCYERKVTSCEKCNNECLIDETVTIEDIGENWCEDCANTYAAQCEDCGCLVTEWNTTEDTNQIYCESCIENNATKCETCNEWYNEIDAHDTDAHPEPTYDAPLAIDADGIFEIMPEFLETKVTVMYKWNQYGMVHEVETITPAKQIEDLKMAGAVMAEIKKTLSHVKHYKTFKTLKRTKTDIVFDVPGSGLFVYQMTPGQYGVYTLCGLYTIGNDKTLDGALRTLYNIKNLIDWNEITTPEIWQNLPSETKRKIKHAVHGG